MRKIKVLLSWLVGMILCLCNAQAGHWTCNPSDFQYDMVAYVGLQIDGAAVTIAQNYEVAAFVGDECRGVAVCEIVDDSGFGYYSLRIRSHEESGETVTFKYYDAVNSVEKDVETILTFEHQSIVGVPSKPFVLEYRNKYRLTYLLDGVEYSVDSIAYGTELVLKDALTKEGHTFNGWSEIPATMPAKDVTVAGTYTVNQYTLTYLVNGIEYKKLTLDYASAITAEAEPTKEGHTFSGWSEIPTTMPAKDVTVVGEFTVNMYQITYMVDGEVYATEQIAYGNVLVLKDAPMKEGYIFSGWSEAPETMPAKDIEVTGSFTVDGIDAVVTGNLVDVYTLQGVMVKRQIPIETLAQELPGGIYIVNGKKMVIR